MNLLLRRAITLSICISILALQPMEASGRTSTRLLLGEAEEIIRPMDHRILRETEQMKTEEVLGKGEAPDSYESSERKVRGGSDPIHNKS
ncbi:hypothetical protein MLD38_004312 [Melastoma candidum]|uniref:Uncharacterized protein n=1 Tax=Melastoma candidum TaxID=119954 RepID=A0ACB9SDW7_9MYRT|nr:hypothetical protein MLD38_004312 [Melastoma candidum]